MPTGTEMYPPTSESNVTTVRCVCGWCLQFPTQEALQRLQEHLDNCGVIVFEPRSASALGIGTPSIDRSPSDYRQLELL